MNPEDYLYLGLDASAYTTSLAVVNGVEEVLFDQRLPLEVKEGSLGLRQSEALFAHLLNFPKLWSDKNMYARKGAFKAVAASAKPRPVAGSYMPVFKVSESFGRFVAGAMNIDFYAFSHQEGHVMAGIWSAALPPGRYLVLHLSGGTTEILSSEEVDPGNLVIELLGGSSDLNAGQFVDRLGLAMGLRFPCGPELEKLAVKADQEITALPVAVKNWEISFSGPASQAERMLKEGSKKENLARAIENCIADSLVAAVNNIQLTESLYQGLLVVGGVAANRHIGRRLVESLGGWKISFARPEYASDNAVGLALLAARSKRLNEK